ncbi:recombinase family protein [Microvirga thermotolerans]|uniref:Serine recombinase n=1 Tax=Microvirga thermotolerans TaxID=2651334 RepID=A0A5P9JWC4_9HYPH|nr:recombinase family protein [Microvirga thermotolerans]QFU15495.1 serine recombinase [Microvirga thermotolerans]
MKTKAKPLKGKTQRTGETSKAVAYIRTSSAANVGADRDSDRRQREAIHEYARRTGVEIVGEHYDAAVSGADPIETRPGFSTLLDEIESSGVRTVIVEDASRFARDLITQELGILALIGRGVTVLTATGDDLTNTSDPFKVAMRQIAGSFSQLEKSRLVSKLAAARSRQRALRGKCEGRKSHAEMNPALVAEAKRLRRRSPRTGKQRSLQEIGQKLAELGFTNANGRPYAAASVRSMVQP